MPRPANAGGVAVWRRDRRPMAARSDHARCVHVAHIRFISPHRTESTMKKSLFALVTLVCAAAAAPVVAAPPHAQQLALACTGTTDAACAARVHAAAAPIAMRNSAARQAALVSGRTAAARELNDGSRFQYDSCGCSN